VRHGFLFVLIVASFWLACGGSAPSASTYPASTYASDPPATGPATAATAPPPAGVATAAPPPLGTPSWVLAIEDWANTVCACPDALCARDAASKIEQPNQADAPLLMKYMGRYTLAMSKGQTCVQSMRH
jgi:hypothetical protein